MYLTISSDRGVFSPFSAQYWELPKSKRECGRIVREYIGVEGPRGNRLRLSATRRMWRGVKMHREGGFTFEPHWGYYVTISKEPPF